MVLEEELACDGVYPSGPVSGWPKERHDELMALAAKGYESQVEPTERRKGVGRLAKGLMKTAGQALRNGKISAEIREERYDTCKACPAFDSSSKRCNDCGCFMEAKTWVGGDPNMLCPQKKWSR
jgi:hypothetical protein